ncbi:MAG TPA: hypothetical protein VGT40_15620 [Methylomirabilota bacterium]|jgi:hypothetical protein|nr:hypothetical protein [Methylomirabilota bacterium]
MTTKWSDVATHCGYCGRAISPELDAPERYGERFCSDAHAEEFAAGVGAARIDAAARAEARATSEADRGGSCALPPTGPRTWRDYLKQGACWGAPLLLLIAVPLVWSGGLAAAGGTLLTAIAFLACPLGMYVMMRGMMNMNQPGGSKARRAARDTEDRHA